MRTIVMIISMGEDTIVSLSLETTEEIAKRMEASEEIKLRVMVKPKEDGNNKQ